MRNIFPLKLNDLPKVTSLVVTRAIGTQTWAFRSQVLGFFQNQSPLYFSQVYLKMMPVTAISIDSDLA